MREERGWGLGFRGRAPIGAGGTATAGAPCPSSPPPVRLTHVPGMHRSRASA